MKIENHCALFCRTGAVLTSLALTATAMQTHAAEPASNAAPATHVLFTSTDIGILHQGAVQHVRDVEGDSFIVKIKDQNVSIPMGTNPEQVKVSRVQVLADRSATVAKFTYDRVYTPANDPVRKWTPAMAAAGEMNDAADATANALKNTSPTMEVRVNVPGNPFGERKTVVNPLYADVAAKAQNAAARVSGNMGSSTSYIDKIREEEALKLFDALEVQFEVSAAKPIQRPYVVVMAKYHEKDDAKYSKNWLFAKALDPIDDRARKISVREAGFPPGFEVEKLQVHLYENGLEIPTDLSENRAPLTRDEAHEYLTIEYMSAHKTDTASPKVVLAQLPSDWAMHRSDAAFRKVFYVKVDQTGHSLGAFEDEACTVKVADEYYAGVLNSLLFLPALQRGKPVDAVAKVTPAGALAQ